MTSKFMMVLSLMLLCVGWAIAQEGGMSKGQMGKGDSGQMKVEGCLQKSGNGFTLTDSAGKTYALQGDNSKMSEHVGHEVMVTGTASGGGSDSSMSSGQGEMTLQVDNLKHISKTCKSAGKMSK
jgi:hypothetical protein